MRYEFDFQMDETTLSDFYTSHNFMGGSGMLWPMIGAAALALAIFSPAGTPMLYRGLYVVFGILFIVYIPWDLKRKARKQLKTNPFYAEPIHYILDEEGVTTIQGDKEASLAWEHFSKIKLTKKSMFLYMRNRNACVFSSSVFGDDLDAAYDWLKTKVSHK